MIKSYYIFNSAFYESLGRAIVLSRLKHLDTLLVLMQIMCKQSDKNKLVITKEFTFDQDNY